jgi:hypothetical protein
MATNATADVNAPGIKPKRKKERTIGIPVKSNLRTGNHGKGIFKFEYFSA